MGRLSGKNCIVTGAAGCIGLETSILFLQEGANVLLADVKADALQAALAKAKDLVGNVPGRAEAFVCDVSKEAEVEGMIKHIDAWGGLDVIFNNAGIMHPQDDDAVNTTAAVWDLTQNTNTKGVWFGSKHAVLSFRRNKKKNTSVINTASIVALVGTATPHLAYTASKGAIVAMTRELAIVHARDGYRFNSLCPGPLDTPLLNEWIGDDMAKRWRREIHFPSGRFGEAIEQARGVVWLASDDSGFYNGQELVIDGGITKAYVMPEGPALVAPKNNAFGR